MFKSASPFLLERTASWLKEKKRYYRERIFKKSMGRQDISEVSVNNEFSEHLKNCYSDYKQDFEAGTYKGFWRYTKDFLSYTHYVYAVASYYNIHSVIEIGTYKGASVCMLMNLFVRQGKTDFHIHTIDPLKQFSITAFSKRTQENYRRFHSNLRFETIKSSEVNLSRRYDLAIIDGDHYPETVRKDYQRVRKSAGMVLFDDLHIDTTYETAFAGIPGSEAEKVFCVYTRDDRNRDPHCIGLLKIKEP